jgi:putative nucleotidyltransferase with HDIG domain
VAIEIPEFEDVPVICKADLNDKNNRQILKRGATYTRSERAASEIVSSAETMRALIDRAVVNRSDRFVTMVDRIIARQADNKAAPIKNEKALTSQISTDKALEKSYDLTLELLGDVLDMGEGSAEGHSKRVTAYTIAIARKMGLSKEEINPVARGAFLHDIGKMAIPHSILEKPGPLTLEEFAIVKEHCLKGYQMLRKIPFLVDVSEIVYAHHENYDGTGYPRGLKNEAIPLGARIVAVANALDSITSDAPFRASRSLGEARTEIQVCSGHQFDPGIVRVFGKLPEGIFRDLRSEIMRGAN